MQLVLLTCCSSAAVAVAVGADPVVGLVGVVHLLLVLPIQVAPKEDSIQTMSHSHHSIVRVKGM